MGYIQYIYEVKIGIYCTVFCDIRKMEEEEKEEIKGGRGGRGKEIESADESYET